ncbi:flavoprotein [Micromonospora sp. ATCC 39149]|uniref:Flavoprotein n=1 Tax=Micromonospora carbonacea TaxID=47853 RepID=A0A7D6C9U1_9ACTN|nr:flavoprotein [Micromonospora sp. ATCC 39149]QLJ97362.1 flavoprotein [Micromonospora carbonacea]
MSAVGVGTTDLRRGSERREVLYVIACGSPLAGHVGRLVELAQQDGWDVCVVTTPDGEKFVDRPALARQTGHPVRSRYKNPGDPDVLPPADAMIVCPATSNTVNKWAAGITDTLALGLLVEGQGKGVPIAAVPFTNEAMARHPAFRASLARLAEWGVDVLFGDHVVPLHPPGSGEHHLHAFPWAAVLAALNGLRCAATPAA